MGAASSSSDAKVKDFEEDMVYLFTFPSIRTCPTFSPFALKVETWLRLRDVKYKAIRDFKLWSQKGQKPFIELNGQEINESSRIISELADKFDKQDPQFTKEQAAMAKMIDVMLDNHTFWSYGSYRILGEESDKFFAMWEGLPSYQRTIAPLLIRRKFRNNFYSHGMGRNSLEEAYSMGCEDIRALAGILGQKQFIMGDQMTSIDCSVFAHLAQILYIPLSSPHMTVLTDEATNLVDYLNRIRDLCWPDWEQFCAQNLQPCGVQ